MFLNVQTQCCAWIKLATDSFSTVLTKNLWNTRDYAPLKLLRYKHDQCTEMYWGIEEKTGHCKNQNYYVANTLNEEKLN